jgi:hypothetical protein
VEADDLLSFDKGTPDKVVNDGGYYIEEEEKSFDKPSTYTEPESSSLNTSNGSVKSTRVIEFDEND